MRLKTSGLKVVVLLSLGAALSGCSALSAVTGHYSDSYGPSWGGMSSETSADSLTVQRIRNRGPAEAPLPLTPEPGDVWPREEGPRATLANPDEALRGGIRPTESEQQPAPRRQRGSGAPLDPVVPRSNMSPISDAPTPPPPRANRTDVPRESGQVFQTPQGPVNATGSGGSRVQTTISPQGSGLAIQDGNTTTLIGPGGNVQQVPTPR